MKPNSFPSMTKLLTLFLVALICDLWTRAQAQSESVHSEWLVLDCRGGVRFSPGFAPLAFMTSANILRGAWDSFTSTDTESYECTCGGTAQPLSASDYIPMALPFIFFFQGPLKDQSAMAYNITRPFCDREPLRATSSTPYSCSRERWGKEKICTLRWDLPSAGINITLAMASCRGATPYVHIGCYGDGCKYIWRICDDDSACGGYGCKNASWNSGDPILSVAEGELIMKFLGLWDDDDANRVSNEGIYNFDIASIFGAVWNGLRAGDDGAQVQNSTQLRMCGAPLVIDLAGPSLQEALYLNFSDPCNVSQTENCTFDANLGVDVCDYFSYYDCSAIVKDWDGVLDGSGQSVVSVERKDGSFYHDSFLKTPVRTPGAAVVFTSSCDGQLKFAPNIDRTRSYGLAVRRGWLQLEFPQFRYWSEVIHKALFEAMAQRAISRSSWLSYEGFMARFHYYGSRIYYNMFTPNVSYTLEGPGPENMSDWHPTESSTWSALIETVIGAKLEKAITILEMPPSCSWETFINNGSCTFALEIGPIMDYDNLTLNFAITQCPGHKFATDVYVECVGEPCAIFNDGIKPCQVENSRCDNGLWCQNLTLAGTLLIPNDTCLSTKETQSSKWMASLSGNETTGASFYCYFNKTGWENATILAERISSHILQMSNGSGFDWQKWIPESQMRSWVPPNAVPLICAGFAPLSAVCVDGSWVIRRNIDSELLGSFEETDNGTKCSESGSLGSPLVIDGNATLAGGCLSANSTVEVRGRVSFNGTLQIVVNGVPLNGSRQTVFEFDSWDGSRFGSLAVASSDPCKRIEASPTYREATMSVIFQVFDNPDCEASRSSPDGSFASPEENSSVNNGLNVPLVIGVTVGVAVLAAVIGGSIFLVRQRMFSRESKRVKSKIQNSLKTHQENL